MKTREHHLISLDTLNGITLHAYLVSTDRNDLTRVYDHILSEAEKQKLRFIPAILATKLEASGIKIVEDHLRKYADADVGKLLDTMANHYYSLFIATQENSKELMDLH